MNLRAALPIGTLAILLSACSAAGDGQGDQSGLGSTGGEATGVAGSPGTITPPAGTAGTPTTQPTSVVTTPPPNNGAGGSTGVVTTPPPGAGGTTVITPPPGAGGSAPAAGGTTGVGGTIGAAGTVGVGGAATDGTTTAVSFSTVTIPVAPGAELVKCQNFKNPIGHDAALLETDSEMNSSHHMFVFHDPSFDTNTNAVADCSGIEFHDLLHMAQTPMQPIVYPAGVGRKLLGTDGLRVLVHLLNTGSEMQTAQVKITFHYADVSAVKQIAVSLFLNTALLSVPPGMSTQSRTSGALPADTNLLMAVSHMHSRAVAFKAQTSDGVMIYQGTEWNEPKPTMFSAPYPLLKAGSTITWACTYNNNTGTTLTFGESANTNEMCILAGTVYPTQTGLDLGTKMEWVI